VEENPDHPLKKLNVPSRSTPLLIIQFLIVPLLSVGADPLPDVLPQWHHPRQSETNVLTRPALAESLRSGV
jgi:hypothetical protein